MKAERRQTALHTAERGDYVQAAPIPLRSKDNAAAVWRPCRLCLVRSRLRDLDRVASGDRLYPDVEVARFVRRVGHESPVRREGWVALESRIERDSRQRQGHGFVEYGR